MLNRNTSHLLLRFAIAAIFLWHGVPKAIDPSAAMDKFVGFGLPGLLGPITGIVEVAAAILLLAGILHPWAAGSLLVIIVGALATVQIPGGMSAGLERDALIFVGLLIILSEGPPAYSIRAGIGKVSPPDRSPASVRPPSTP